MAKWRKQRHGNDVVQRKISKINDIVMAKIAAYQNENEIKEEAASSEEKKKMTHQRRDDISSGGGESGGSSSAAYRGMKSIMGVSRRSGGMA